MNRFYLGVLWLVLPWVGSIAFAVPPQYAVIDLGVQEAGQGLQWHGVVGAPITGYPGLGGDNILYAFNSAAQVGTATTPDQTTVNADVALPLVDVDEQQVASTCESAGTSEAHASGTAGDHKHVGVGHVRASR